MPKPKPFFAAQDPETIQPKAEEDYKSATVKLLFKLLPTVDAPQLEPLRVYYEQFKKCGLHDSDFYSEMFAVKRLIDENLLILLWAAGKAGKPIKRRITSAYREIDPSDGQEKIVYHMSLSSSNKFDQPLHAELSSVGVCSIPIFEKRYDKMSEDFLETVNLTDSVRKYYIPWNAENVKKLGEHLDDGTNFYLKHSEGRKYTIDRDSWMNKPRQEIEDAINSKLGGHKALSLEELSSLLQSALKGAKQ